MFLLAIQAISIGRRRYEAQAVLFLLLLSCKLSPMCWHTTSFAAVAVNDRNTNYQGHAFHTHSQRYIPIRVSFHLFHKEIGFNQMAVLQLIWCFLTKLRTVSSVTDSSQKLLAGTLCSVTVNFLLSREASHYKFTRTFYHP